MREVKEFRLSSLSSAAEQRRFAMDDRVVESFKEQLEVEEEDGDRQEEKGGSRKGEANQRGCTM